MALYYLLCVFASLRLCVFALKLFPPSRAYNHFFRLNRRSMTMAIRAMMDQKTQ